MMRGLRAHTQTEFLGSASGRLPFYTEADIKTDGKDLEGKLLGAPDESVMMDDSAYAQFLADEMQKMEPPKGLGEAPSGQEIAVYFTREEISHVLNGVSLGESASENTPQRNLQIREWMSYALSNIRESMRSNLDEVVDELKEHQEEGAETAFGYCLQERFDILNEIRSDEDKHIVELINGLLNMNPNKYYSIDAGEVIDQEDLKDLFLKAFDLPRVPANLEALVCEPHLDRETFANSLTDLQMALGSHEGLRETIMEAKMGRPKPYRQGYQAKLYTATDTKLDYVGGVDAFVEIADSYGAVVDRIMFDVTVNPDALEKKKKKIRQHRSFADSVYLFERDDILPIEHDPSKTHSLQKEHFRKLLRSMDRAC